MHKRLEQLEKGFSCDECEQYFTSKYNLNRHIVNKHKEHNKKFNCEVCSKTFQRKDKLKDHMENIHKVLSSEGYLLVNNKKKNFFIVSCVRGPF